MGPCPISHARTHARVHNPTPKMTTQAYSDYLNCYIFMSKTLPMAGCKPHSMQCISALGRLRRGRAAGRRLG